MTPLFVRFIKDESGTTAIPGMRPRWKAKIWLRGTLPIISEHPS